MSPPLGDLAGVLLRDQGNTGTCEAPTMGADLVPALVLGLFIRAGDGPARWEIEWLGRGPETATIVRELMTVARVVCDSTGVPVSCAWRWRIANEIRDAWSEHAAGLDLTSTPATGWVFEGLEVQHTHGAPLAYTAAGEPAKVRLYLRHRLVLTEARVRDLRPCRGSPFNVIHRRTLWRLRAQAAVGRRSPASVPRKARRASVLYACNVGDPEGFES